MFKLENVLKKEGKASKYYICYSTFIMILVIFFYTI